MLPWRRNKFVLVEDEAKCKAKSLSPGLAYTSLLSSFLRSCPDLLPDWPLERLGHMFRSRRQKVELNKEDPTYTVWYLGNAVTLHAKGDGCTDDAVGKIWARCGPGGGTKMKLTLGRGAPRLSSIQEEDEEDEEEHEGGAPQSERPEVLSLTRELRTCSLRGAPAPPPSAQPRRWKAGARERAGQAR
ncbi:protein FAM43B [Tupaia chinensis]|uniref:protein FAM43B n=1 Tax=Tupaia chinensis TaxID=246437 RepID=UPI0007043EFC|nr:protein FAM43B [Tupaia chinensis]